MISILPQESLDICFDGLAGSLRPQWEIGPNYFSPGLNNQLSVGTVQAATAIHGHIYYVEQLNDLLDYGANISNRYYLLNTNCIWKANVIEDILKLRGEKDYEIRIMPNRGRDIGSLLVGWKDKLEQYEILVHCHTKKTPHAPDQFGRAWRESLMQGVFPGEETCMHFQKLLSAKDGGIIMPWPHRVVAHNVNWGNNFKQTRELMGLMGYEITRDTLLVFPAGSFFWAHASCLKPMMKLGLRWDDFKEEPLQGDGFLAHALERCFGLLPMLSGRTNYVHWSGRRCHDLSTGPEKPALIPIPRPSEGCQHTRTWFKIGWLGSVESNSSPEKSFPLHRRLPGKYDRELMSGRVNFMIAGAQKAGTTSIANYLREHPQIFLPSRKELHFFDDEELDWPNADLEKLHENYEKAKPEQLWGDATPITMYWERCAERIWRYNTNMRMIIILRDPVDRAYSHWAMETKRGLETLSFEKAIHLEQERARTALPQQDRVHSYLDRGRYSEQIRRLWRWFGEENVLVLKQETLKVDPQLTLDKICKFLSIERQKIHEELISNKGCYDEPIDKTVRSQLITTMRGEIISLEKMLGWDCSDWLRV